MCTPIECRYQGHTFQPEAPNSRVAATSTSHTEGAGIIQRSNSIRLTGQSEGASLIQRSNSIRLTGQSEGASLIQRSNSIRLTGDGSIAREMQTISCEVHKVEGKIGLGLGGGGTAPLHPVIAPFEPTFSVLWRSFGKCMNDNK